MSYANSRARALQLGVLAAMVLWVLRGGRSDAAGSENIEHCSNKVVRCIATIAQRQRQIHCTSRRLKRFTAPVQMRVGTVRSNPGTYQYNNRHSHSHTHCPARFRQKFSKSPKQVALHTLLSAEHCEPALIDLTGCKYTACRASAAKLTGLERRADENHRVFLASLQNTEHIDFAAVRHSGAAL